MSKTTSRMIGCALTLAALFTTGCHVQLGTTPVVDGKPPVTASTATGKVKVAFQGLGAYKTLATRYDIHRVELTLQPARGKAQFRKVGLEELQQGSVSLDFKKVATGQAELHVTAFDAGKQVIGKGYNAAHVSARSTAFIHVAVKMDGDPDSGNVNALITFEDGLDDEAIFFESDRNGDGYLNFGEFRSAYNRRPWPIPMVGNPAVAVCNMIGPDGAAPIAPMPPVEDPLRSAFAQKDWNGDGLLSLDEFLGRMYAMPVPAAEAE